jgi:prophage antirepressor-like protein
MKLAFVRDKKLGKVKCDFYTDEENQVWMTREQIGKALGYSYPVRAIYRIHTHNKDRLDQFSTHTKLVGDDGKMHDTYIYDIKGISEICRWSSKPQANQFLDWVWDVMEDYRKGELAPAPNNPVVNHQNQERARILMDMADNFKGILSPESVALLASRAAELMETKLSQ